MAFCSRRGWTKKMIFLTEVTIRKSDSVLVLLLI